MAKNLISTADGNWTDAATWGLMETGSGAEQTSKDLFSNATGSYQWSSAFTFTLNDVCDGILLHCVRQGTSGTVTVCLSIDGATETRTVVVNASDLPAATGWVLFKFGSTVTGDGGTGWKVGVKSLSAGQATFYRTGAGTNWTRLLRLTATGTPAATDTMYVVGELTGAGTGNNRVVTYNETVVARGDASTAYAAVIVSGNTTTSATLQAQTTAATNYALRVTGALGLEVFGGGNLLIGTAVTEFPATSTFDVVLAAVAAVGVGFMGYNGSQVKLYGGIPGVTWTVLNADAGIGATSLTSLVATGWPSGGTVALAPTTRTATERESKVMSGAASGTTIPIAALTNAHGGNAATGVVGEIALLDRNVMIRGADATNTGYVNFAAGCVVVLSGVEVKWMGSPLGGKLGINVASTVSASGSFTAVGCSVHDFPVAYGIISTSAASGSLISITNCVFYLPGTVGIYLSVADSGTPTISGCLIIGATSHGVSLLDIGGTITNNVAAGCGGSGFNLSETSAVIGTFTGNTAHSNAGNGVAVVSAVGGTIGTSTVWRNNAYYGLSLTTCSNLAIATATIFGNGSSGIIALSCLNLAFSGITANAGSALTQPAALQPAGCGLTGAISDSSFGGTTPHSTGDIWVAAAGLFVDLLCTNVLFGSTTEVANPSNMASGSAIRSHKHDQTAGQYKVWMPNGVVQIDTTLFKTASPSTRLVPTSASLKLESRSKYRAVRIPVASGQTATPTVWVRESVVGDGTDYNGNRARLIVKVNPSAGIAVDTVLDTATVASEGAWEQLSGTTAAVTENCVLEFLVDCDGTTGWLNVDDWGGGNSNDAGSLLYWFQGEAAGQLAADSTTATNVAAILARLLAVSDADSVLLDATQVAAIQSGLATSLALTAVGNNVGAIQTILSGITSLAAWLRGLYRKTAMDATAKGEVNAGGTTAYDEATDSQEALRDRGDAAWATATGFSTLAAQDVANALKLTPTAGDPAEGSVNKDLDTIAADVAGLDGAAMRGTDGAYTGTPPTAAAIATAVWNALTSALTTADSIGKKLADWTILTSLAIRDALKLAPTAGDPAVGSVDKHLDDILEDTGTTLPAQIAAIGPGSGTGARTVTYTVTDSVDGDPVMGTTMRYYSDAARTHLVALSTGTVLGVVQAWLDDGAYYWSLKATGYADKTGTLTVNGNEVETTTMVAIVAPDAPADPATLTIYADSMELTGVRLGAGVGTFEVLSSELSPDMIGSLSVLPSALTSDTTDANGRAELTLARGLICHLKLSATEQWWEYQGTVPSAAALAAGTVTLATLVASHGWVRV